MYPVRAAILFLFAGFLAGCDEEVVDATKTSRPFTLYGYLDPRSDVQVVRVFPIQHMLEQVGPEPLDAQVRFFDLEEEVVYSSRDSVVAYPSGEHGHLYNAHFRPRHGSTYRVEVTRSDGETSAARVTVPSEVAIEEENPFVTLSLEGPTPLPHLPIFVRGEPTWLATVTAIYDVQIVELDHAHRQIRIAYDFHQEQVPGGWRVALNLASDFEYIMDRLSREFGGVVREYAVEFLRLRFQADVVNEGWYPPTGNFDADLLVEPGVMSNVENGFGFIGSGYKVTYQVDPSACLMYWAGFTYPGDPCTREDWCNFAGFRCD